jgi:phage shock protein A
MGGLSDTGAFDTFDRMAKKVDQIEAEAEAHVEIGQELTGDTLQQKFKALEAGSASTDDALATLKAKMGLAPPPQAKAALPPGAATDPLAELDAVKAEMETVPAKNR